MMVFAVDRSAQALDRLCAGLPDDLPEVELRRFQSSLEALAEARRTAVDVALLAVDLPELGGLDLGRYLKEMYPLVNLIYLSQDAEDCYEAMAMHASGYLLQPAGAEELRRELGDLRYPTDRRRRQRVFAQTFGNFELFVDGQPVAFKYSRTKEIVAVLVNNRGAQTTNGELIGCLWEDDGDPDRKASYLRNLRQDLQNTLNRLGVADIIVKQRGSLGIAAERIECDLYDWLEKRDESRYRYMGDYMNQYSWAETLHAELDEIVWGMEDSLE